MTYEELSKLQQVVARRMSESKATAPHFYLEAEIDMSRPRSRRGRGSRRWRARARWCPPSTTWSSRRARWRCGAPAGQRRLPDGRFELYSRVNVGVAVAAQDALVVPTVFDADRKGLRQIAADARALAGKVRDGSITPPELSGGTFTVSNLGMYGIDNFSAVINTPQAAILAVGAIKERPVVRDGEITTAHMLGVTLACDHRILYGAPAAEFLARVRALLEEPLLSSALRGRALSRSSSRRSSHSTPARGRSRRRRGRCRDGRRGRRSSRRGGGGSRRRG